MLRVWKFSLVVAGLIVLGFAVKPLRNLFVNMLLAGVWTLLGWAVCAGPAGAICIRAQGALEL
ncbi:hypothetical protein HMPREF2757_02135 [Brevibacterium sp. HMSC063G07]|nr:hypothetical protein HMPREF2757_02135 [Brevibacterium sp. HMSC063G07]